MKELNGNPGIDQSHQLVVGVGSVLNYKKHSIRSNIGSCLKNEAELAFGNLDVGR